MGDGDEIRHSSSSGEAQGMKLAAMDTLSELVWSPRNGLSLRCADFSFAGKRQLLSPNFFDIGQSSNTADSKSIKEEARSLVDVQLRTTGDLSMDRTEDQACGGRSNEVNRPLSGADDSVGDMRPEREEMVEDKVETNDDSENEEAATKVESSKRSLDSPRVNGRITEALLANEEGEGDKKNGRDLCVDRLESTDENDLATLAAAASKALVACESKGECFPDDEADVDKAGPSGSYMCHAKEKGKEKALSDGSFDGNDDDESFGSVESCNSAGLQSKGKKRPGFEQQLIHGSKRLKTLGQECLGSTSKLKQDSSFMNWISNMTKGIWKGNEEENSSFVALTTSSDANAIVDQQKLSPCCLKEDSGCRNTGFQSFFQSIYCPRKRSQDAIETDFPNNANAPSLQELPWIPEQCNKTTKGDDLSSFGNEIAPVAAEPNVSSGKVGCNQTSETFSSEKRKHEEKEPNISPFSLVNSNKLNEEQRACGEADEKVNQCITNRNSGLESLWLSRFSSKSSFPQEKDLHERIITDEEANDESQKVLTDTNNLNTNHPVVSSLRIESSEAMVSLFARRLEAIKQIIPSGSLSENTEEGQRNLMCFYCGKRGHRLQDCLEVTDTELRDLVQNISARNEKEESAGLCIRCFQLSHWAATCPAVNHVSTKLPVSDFTEVPKIVFNAVQVLRLTRTNVLKWINTKKSVSGLEGFFLRLRLGKWEEGLGGTGYYVARIDDEGESSEKSSISVKVKGMSCLVEPQFISNHDFLEEELKAWWQSVGKSAGRSGADRIPSAEELTRKIQQRKLLGF